MTANTSPRLGLMLPQNTDPFDPNDFVSTFTTLDNTPGVTPISNYAALPVGLTASQHGSLYLQTDNTALWMWNKPTSGSTGSFRRINALGLLANSSQATTVVTAAVDDAHAPTIVTCTITVPGGRPLLVMTEGTFSNTSANGGTDFFVSMNGTAILRNNFTDGGTATTQGGYMYLAIGLQTPGSTLVFKSLARTLGTGTSTITGTRLHIYET